MSKMGDMAATIEELRQAAATINDIADWLTEQFSGAVTSEPEPEAKPEPPLTVEDIRPILARISRKGHGDEIRALIHEYGAEKLSDVDPAHLRDLLAEVEALDHAE